MGKLYKELEAYGKSDFYPFHMPGHKRNLQAVEGDFPLERDITEISGFDNLHHPEGIIKEAQEAAARLYGTQKCLFSVNGSTAALQAAISACVQKGGKILMARNCHKAVYHTLYLRDIQPVYIYPQSDPKLGINGGISPVRVERYLEENQDVEAVLITSPTYDGVVSDVKNIAHAAHKFGIPLIVDEAHGAHLRFSDYFPDSAADLGADIVVQSFHKTLPSMTQTAVLHVCSSRPDMEKIRRFMDIYQTSSPSYILMASIDACIDKLSRDGSRMFEEFTKNLEAVRHRLCQCRHIVLINPDLRPETLKCTGVYGFDRSKFLFSTVGTSLTGKTLHEILREEFHIEMEMESENYVLGITSVCDTKEGMDRLVSAIEEIDRREGRKDIKETEEKEPCTYAKMVQMTSFSQAMDAPQKRCHLEESIGRISGEFAYLYPPGTPILVPGEQITGHFVRNVRRYLEQGFELQGLSDSTNQTICVVAR